jgi:hypothetical protein
VAETDPLLHLRKLSHYLSSFRFNFSSEAELQTAIAQVLEMRGFSVKREVAITSSERLDFLIDETIAIEVKIGGSANDALRQIARYAYQDVVQGILLVTTRASHSCPGFLCGKPLLLHRLTESFL